MGAARQVIQSALKSHDSWPIVEHAKLDNAFNGGRATLYIEDGKGGHVILLSLQSTGMGAHMFRGSATPIVEELKSLQLTDAEIASAVSAAVEAGKRE